jgi:hypothetical protein
MSTRQSTAHLSPRFRIGPVLTALGALVAIAVTIIMLALTGANHTTVAIPVTASQAAAGPTTQIRYLGPHQLREGLGSQTARTLDGGTAPTAGAGNAAPHYTCLGSAKRCLP